MIYVASPYSHPDSAVRQQRYEAVVAFMATLVPSRLAFSPIMHTHDMTVRHNIAGDFATWQRYCLGMIDKADAFWVLPLEGWRESKGVAAEIDYALARGMQVLIKRVA